MIHVHMTSCTLLTCDFSLGSLTLPAVEIGYFVEEILLYTHHCINPLALELNIYSVGHHLCKM